MQRAGLRRIAWRAGHRARATMTFAVAALAISTLVGVLTYASSRAYLTEQREAAARDRTYLDARLVREHLRATNADPGAALAELAPEEGAAALVRVGGAWFSSSVAVAVDDVPSDVLAAAEHDVAWRRYDQRGEPKLAIALPLPAVGAVYAEVVPLGQLEQTLRTLGSSLVIAVVATTVLGAGIGFVAAGRLVRPLRRLVDRAEAIAAGDAAELDALADDPELVPLVRSLNRLIEDNAQRAAQDSRFVSDVSHEIRAPLAALSAAIEVMQRRRAQMPARSADALDVLRDQIDGFQQLVLDLLEISRIDAGRSELRTEPTDCELLVRHAAAAVGMPELAVDVGVDVPAQVMLDRRRMGQALMNLLENARRYAGGPTCVKVQRRDGHLLFAVHDAGPGVPAEERSRIFGRFERGEHGVRGPRGTGLGLALVAEHAALHGGRAYVDEADGSGAVFVVEVELCEAE